MLQWQARLSVQKWGFLFVASWFLRKAITVEPFQKSLLFTVVDLCLDAKFSKSPQYLTSPRTPGSHRKVLGICPCGHFPVGLQPYGGAAWLVVYPKQPASPCLKASVPGMTFLLWWCLVRDMYVPSSAKSLQTATLHALQKQKKFHFPTQHCDIYSLHKGPSRNASSLCQIQMALEPKETSWAFHKLCGPCRSLIRTCALAICTRSSTQSLQTEWHTHAGAEPAADF